MGRLNQNPLVEIPFNDFKGGYAGAKGVSTLATNEAQDLDNIIILPNGGGFKNRLGNSEELNNGVLTTVVNPVQGIISFKKASTEHLIWCTNNSGGTVLTVYEHDISGSTHTSRHTIAAGADGQNNIFSLFKFNDLVIGVSDNRSVPFKIDMSGTPSGAVLGGSPPSGKVGIAWNNVAWIGNTSTDTSKLFYSVINNPEDWSSSGSGFVYPQKKDGDELIALAPISNNVMLFFKRHSIFQVVGRADPFAVYPLFQGVGCVGKNALVQADGLVHFITAEGKMRITDGSRIYDDKDIPQLSYADDLWAQVPKTRLPYVQGVRHVGADFDHIVFLVSLGSSQSTNNYAIIWDFKNKCWLKNSTGWNGNCATTLNDGTVYVGGYAGRLYKQQVASKYTDDSGVTPTLSGTAQVVPTSPVPIRWYWRTDDLALQSLQNVVQIARVNVLTEYQSTGNFRLSYGYDNYHDTNTLNTTINPGSFVLGTSILGVGVLGSYRYQVVTNRPLGRGQTFNLKMEGTQAVASKITKFTLVGRQAATKVQEVR